MSVLKCYGPYVIDRHQDLVLVNVVEATVVVQAGNGCLFCCFFKWIILRI